ncbi:MAG: FAD binding domain-containing protein [Nannocystales bacterium]
MLRLPRFGVQSPETLEDAVTALSEPGARLVAGGTDILPNLKHRLDQPPVLVSLSRVRSLREISERDGMLVIGAGVTLTELSEHPRVQELFGSLAYAAGVIASPLIRNMGTLGGNVNLDTRCRYVNQTHFWRTAIGGCLKAKGEVCHVVPKGRICVAAMSSDLVPVLGSLNATLVNQGPQGPRELPLLEYYGADGTKHIKRLEGEVTREVRVPVPTGATRARYAKWTVRKSIDFPLVSVAVRFDLGSDSADAEVTGVSVVVGVLGSKPRALTRLDDVVGMRLSDPAVAELVAERAYAQCKPLENVPYDAPYRRQMVRVHTQRAVEAMVAEG